MNFFSEWNMMIVFQLIGIFHWHIWIPLTYINVKYQCRIDGNIKQVKFDSRHWRKHKKIIWTQTNYVYTNMCMFSWMLVYTMIPQWRIIDWYHSVHWIFPWFVTDIPSLQFTMIWNSTNDWIFESIPPNSYLIQKKFQT